jgi:HAD superfamily hydrolase (TIGR01509 family)
VLLPSRVGAVVLDLDGTLVDTESAWLAAEAELAAEAGHRFGPADVAACRGGSIETVTTYLIGLLGVPTSRHQEVATDLAVRVAAHQPVPPVPMPGALELVRALAGRVPLGIVTNSGRAELERVLDGIGLAEQFPVTVSADDVEWPKPHPDGYLQAFAALGADPRRCVVIEDSATGAEAARAAGALLVTVPADAAHGPRGDLTLATLADPAFLAWAAAVQRAAALAPADVA